MNESHRNARTAHVALFCGFIPNTVIAVTIRNKKMSPNLRTRRFGKKLFVRTRTLTHFFFFFSPPRMRRQISTHEKMRCKKDHKSWRFDRQFDFSFLFFSLSFSLSPIICSTLSWLWFGPAIIGSPPSNPTPIQDRSRSQWLRRKEKNATNFSSSLLQGWASTSLSSGSYEIWSFIFHGK